ncbi:hypothetical protein U6G28_02450 [Actinomycetaceae bacterium MB13-C1-2]|nr:hypothetical protein U6G28_02450 [Actinomycetaceae bacterium MB13-C1-2]
MNAAYEYSESNPYGPDRYHQGDPLDWDADPYPSTVEMQALADETAMLWDEL